MATPPTTSYRPPEAFSGKSDEIFRSWLQRMTHYFKLCNAVDDGKKLSMLLMNLKGNAYVAAERLGCTADNVTYQAAVDLLSEHFIPPENKAEYRMQFAGRDMKTGESVEIYARELRLLVSQAYPDFSAAAQEELAIQRFIKGIRTPITSQRIFLKECKKLSEAVGFAKMSETAFTLNRAQRSVQSVSSVQNEPGTSSSSSAQQSSSSANFHSGRPFRGGSGRPGFKNRGGRNNYNGPMRCFNCNEVGHKRYQCPQLQSSSSGQSANVGFQQGGYSGNAFRGFRGGYRGSFRGASRGTRGGTFHVDRARTVNSVNEQPNEQDAEEEELDEIAYDLASQNFMIEYKNTVASCTDVGRKVCLSVATLIAYRPTTFCWIPVAQPL